MSYWRQEAQHHIWEALRENNINITDNLSNAPEEKKREVKRIFKNAYPFGVRKHHPYKIWCEEQRKTLKAIGVSK
jgi:hypothetical protein